METVLKDKIHIGISACAYGCKVRYNAKGWNLFDNFEREKSYFIVHPLCPETMAGLGTPRSPIRIVGENGFSVLNGEARIKNREGLDLTNDILRGSNACLDTLKANNVFAFIYLEGSPSCGVYRTTLKNKRLGKPPGVFGAMLLKEGFFLIPGNDLDSPIKRWDWRRRLQAFAWTKEVEINSKADLINMWHILKFLCQELDEVKSREIGRQIAASPKGFNREFAEKVRWEVLMLLRKPSSIEKIKNRLWKHYSYFKRATGESIDQVMQPEGLRNMTHIAEELILMERHSHQNNLLFGGAPILYKGR